MGRQATPQEIYDAIFGAGIPAHWSWWDSFTPEWADADEVPDTWVVQVIADNPDDEDMHLHLRINHLDILDAARKIEADPKYRESLRDECWNLLTDVDEADIDADDADAILQVAVFGDIIFG